MRRRVSVLLLLLSLVPVGAWAGSSTISPGQSIRAALNGLGPGDTLYLRGGTYTEIITTGWPSGSSWNNPVTVSSAPGEHATLVGYIGVNEPYVDKFLIIQDFTIDASNACPDCNGVYLGASSIRLQRMEIINYPNMGVQAYTGSHVEILNNRIHHTLRSDCGRGCTHGMYLALSYSVIDGNETYDNSGYGIQMYCSGCQGQNHDNIIRNNRVYGNGYSNNPGGMTINGGPHLVYNNVVYNNTRGASGIDLTYEVVGVEVYHNTIYGNNAYGIAVAHSARGVILRNNIVVGNGTQIDDPGGVATQDHNLLSDASFVNAGGGDFHLQSGSAAIDMGMDLDGKGNGLKRDKEGHGRPVGGWDAGAYEYGSTGEGPPDDGPSQGNGSAKKLALPAPTDLKIVFVP